MSDKYVSVRRAGVDYAVVIDGQVQYVFTNKDAAVAFARRI